MTDNSELDQWLLDQRKMLRDRLKANCEEANKIGDGLVEVENALAARGLSKLRPAGRPKLRLVKS